MSVIMPAFNVAEYIGEALDSVLAQDVAGLEIEVIVIDDGSTDDTAQIVATYGDRVRYVPLARCGRAGRVRNHGIRLATGEYIAFLDADDFWLESSLRDRIAILEARPRVGLVHGNYYTLTDGVRTLNFNKAAPPEGDIFTELFRYNFIHTSSVVVRRDLLERAGGFHPHVRSAEDYWLWLQMAARGEVAFVDQPVSVYRLRPGSLSTNALTAKLPDLMRVVVEIAREFSVPAHVLWARVNPLRIWLAKEHARRGRYISAARYLLPALCRAPLSILRGGVRSVRSLSVQSVQ